MFYPAHIHSTTDAITIFLTARKTKGISSRTLETYTYRLRIFNQANSKLPTKPQTIEDFLATTGPTMETRDSYYRLLRNFYNALVHKKLVRRNPVLAVQPPKLSRKVARSLSPTELAQLLNHPGHSTQMAAFLCLLADTGIRISEALSVTHQSIRHNTIVVQGKTGERELPISPTVVPKILEALPWPWKTRAGASHAVKKAFIKAGITGRRASAHSLRHSFVRLWEGEESLLVNILGWTSPAMLKVYKPYNLIRAVDQHHQYSPLRQAQAAALQPRLL